MTEQNTKKVIKIKINREELEIQHHETGKGGMSEAKER